MGDVMKLQRWHLFAISGLCFFIVYISINSKFDPFYRVNGIDNDNRALIENHLSIEEQAYLIEHAIPLSEFVGYIEYSNFYLPNYEYYNILAEAKIFNDDYALINNTNLIIERLEVVYKSKTLSALNQIIENNLVVAYLNQTSFDLDYIPYYQKVRALYTAIDFSYINDTNSYVSMLHPYVSNDKLEETFTILCQNYDKNTLALLLNTQVDDTIQKVFNPSAYDTIVDANHYIGSYSPSKLVVANNINRTYYSIYLQEETYTNLLLLNKAISEQVGSDLLLSGGYRSYDILLQEQSSTIKSGFNEYQLGTTVEFIQKGLSNDLFSTGVYYEWLVENAHHYGFIIRYPSTEEAMNSSNVFRYVGIDLATKLYEENISFNDYIYGGNEDV